MALIFLVQNQKKKDGITYGNSLTSDVKVRRAINLAIDREEMIKNVLNGYGTVAYSVCDKMPWYNEEAVTEYDLDAAKALMEEAGWIEGDDGIREKMGKKQSLQLCFQMEILCARHLQKTLRISCVSLELM